MQLTKTNFIQYLSCPESLWLLKNKENEYPFGEFSLFQEKLRNEGFEVEHYAQLLFPDGLRLDEYIAPTATKKELDKGLKFYFQPSFETSRGGYAVIDILERSDNNTWHIYEIKSSTSIKTDSKHNQIKDACFQKYVMTEAGYTVSKVSIINLNKGYIKNGDINPSELLEIVDITNEVNQIYSETVNEINTAFNFLKKDISIDRCSCIEKTRSNHCDAFNYFNSEIDEHNIYELNRISVKKIKELRELGVSKIKDIPDNYNLTAKQQLQLVSNQKEEAVYDLKEIKNTLSELKFPLHFIDYETFPTAVPKIDGLSPHEQLTFQVSIHTLLSDGTLKHYEYLSDSLELPKKLIEYMESITGLTGTFVSWHASFEKGRNDDMMRLFPEHKPYLDFMNTNMFDLETIFTQYYVDYRFLGKTSIKNVLPVLVPELSYKVLNVQNGTEALDTWGRLVLEPEKIEDKESVRKDLLEYCKLDTLAMVKIYEKLIAL
ncbi:DUF2779 domain-containing protein [uncultured Algibacter sp.]|uniref:DUF2779 domain-containing protein n=1 Tax=uncultured Algibacter sp. TaxID=298659 RepID=UPI00260B2420|nr:DUF2779 domain-containing protein [uncultured Algibacter sp.]